MQGPPTGGAMPGWLARLRASLGIGGIDLTFVTHLLKFGR